MGMADVVARTGMQEAEIAAAAAKAALVTSGQPQPWYVDRAWMQATRDRLVKTVQEFHRKNPLLPGMARQDLRGRELQDAPAFVLDALLADAKELVAEGETVRSRGHKLCSTGRGAGARAIRNAFEQVAWRCRRWPTLAKSGVETARARSLLQILLREKRLVRISEELVFHQSALEKLRQMLGERRGKRFSVAESKEWTGVSRKDAIPLLEFLDREKITRREGDERAIL
jgi:selenocysteine-specific elongation factor